MRVGALQDWPLFCITCLTPLVTAALEVGVGEDDVGGFAAELLVDALDGGGGGAGDLDAGAGAAGEADEVDVRVGC